MKKLIVVFCLTLSTFMLPGCGGSSNAEEKNPAHSAQSASAVEVADVDMTQMPKMMVYSEINFMSSNPERYEGKSIRVAGNLEYDPHLRRRYCMVSDSTACCTVGLEFLQKGDRSHPFINAMEVQNDSEEVSLQPDPANGSPIVIQGIFRSFQEREKQSVILTDCKYCAPLLSR